MLILAIIGSGCAGTEINKTAADAPEAPFRIKEISNGLPSDGLWRETIALADMNGDGFLDIVAPPQRKAAPALKKPSIFLWDMKEGGWKEGSFKFPDLKDYDYGGIAVGDINRDGLPDIVIATHMGRIIVLMNDGHGGFVESAFATEEKFHSRAIALSDINGDGWPDIISLSESGVFYKDYTNMGAAAPPGQKRTRERERNEAPGLLLGINKSGGGWDVRFVEGTKGLFGDSLAVGAVTAAGGKDIVIAPLMDVKGLNSKVLWKGDGKGDFKEYKDEIFSDYLMYIARTGDVDGDGRDEAVFLLSGLGSGSESALKAFKWTAAGGFSDISSGIGLIKEPYVFDLADIDGDGKDELIVLAQGGLHVFKWSGAGWVELGHHPIPQSGTKGAKDLRAGRQADGSLLIVYNLGKEQSEIERGLRAYMLNLR